MLLFKYTKKAIDGFLKAKQQNRGYKQHVNGI